MKISRRKCLELWLFLMWSISEPGRALDVNYALCGGQKLRQENVWELVHRRGDSVEFSLSVVSHMEYPTQPIPEGESCSITFKYINLKDCISQPSGIPSDLKFRQINAKQSADHPLSYTIQFPSPHTSTPTDPNEHGFKFKIQVSQCSSLLTPANLTKPNTVETLQFQHSRQYAGAYKMSDLEGYNQSYTKLQLILAIFLAIIVALVATYLAAKLVFYKKEIERRDIEVKILSRAVSRQSQLNNTASFVDMVNSHHSSCVHSRRASRRGSLGPDEHLRLLESVSRTANLNMLNPHQAILGRGRGHKRASSMNEEFSFKKFAILPQDGRLRSRTHVESARPVDGSGASFTDGSASILGQADKYYRTHFNEPRISDQCDGLSSDDSTGMNIRVTSARPFKIPTRAMSNDSETSAPEVIPETTNLPASVLCLPTAVDSDDYVDIVESPTKLSASRRPRADRYSYRHATVLPTQMNTVHSRPRNLSSSTQSSGDYGTPIANVPDETVFGAE